MSIIGTNEAPGRHAGSRPPVLAVLSTAIVLSGCVSTPPLSDERWLPLETGSDASLRGVCVVNRDVIWASGSNGTVLKSADGGATWQRFQVPGPASCDVRDIEAVDAQHAWAISITEPARILHTADGGRSWRVLHESANPASFFDSIALLDDGAALVFGDPQDGVFEVLRSDDGEGWNPVPAGALPPALEGEAAFAASGTCIVTFGSHHAWISTGGRAARVLRSADGGRSWTAAETPIRQGGETTGIYSVAFRDEMHGVIVGGDYTEPERSGDNAAYTTDGGVSWTAATTPPGGYRSCVIDLPGRPDTLVAVGRTGCDYSEDGGRTWHPLGDGEGFYAVSAARDGTVIAVGSDGRAARLVFADTDTDADADAVDFSPAGCHSRLGCVPVGLTTRVSRKTQSR
jgi:photosystem II stability/assembly factor-like uncharacterized protein